MTALSHEVADRGAPPRRSSGSRGATSGARAAADRAVSAHTVTLDLLGRRVELPPADQLAFLAGLGILAAFEIIE
ncbi:MAG TPA: hypothetical protein VFY14_16420, partial [Streptomyces sp.]|nr:hypothetical protein [Streptomyces sp.]